MRFPSLKISKDKQTSNQGQIFLNCLVDDLSFCGSFISGLLFRLLVIFFLNLFFFSILPKAARAQSCPRIQFQSAFKDYKTFAFPKTESTPDDRSPAKDYEAAIPPNLKPTANAGEVAVKFGDQVLQNWLKSDAVKLSPLGSRATQVENALRTEVVVEKGSTGSTDHHFSLQFLALQALTKLEYKGWLNATVNYDANAAETDLELKERIWNKKEFFLNHKKTPIEGLSSMGVRWDW